MRSDSTDPRIAAFLDEIDRIIGTSCRTAAKSAAAGAVSLAVGVLEHGARALGTGLDSVTSDGSPNCKAMMEQ